LNAPDAAARELAAFAGEVQCEQAAGAVNLVLRGRTLATDGPLAGRCEILFSDASDPALPAKVRDVRILELPPAPVAAPSGAPVRRRFRIEAAQLQRELQARSVQLHHDAAAPFYRAVPPPRVPLRLRLGWTLLLALLRIPGAGVVVRTLRGPP